MLHFSCSHLYMHYMKTITVELNELFVLESLIMTLVFLVREPGSGLLRNPSLLVQHSIG